MTQPIVQTMRAIAIEAYGGPEVVQVRHDAPVSVARAFTREDWDRLLVQAGLDPAKVSVEWFFPFRYGVGFTR